MTVLLHLQFHIVLLFLFTKVELILSASQMHNIEWTNARQARLNGHLSIQWTLLFLCSSVLKTSKHPLNTTNARETSSLARTRDLILMKTPKPARHNTSPTIRFLVPARNDSLATSAIPYSTSVLIYKSRVDTFSIADAQHWMNKCTSSSLERSFEYSMNSFVLMFFCLKNK